MTARPAFELADVFRRHGETYAQLNAGHLGRVERRVSAAIAAYRTAALGGHVERCDDCGLTRIAYNSCRNRHCPKCQGAARVKWLAAREAELLPVPYFHVVFTLPPAAAEIAFHNKRTVEGRLMRAAAQALSVLAAKRLGARIGLIAVLHTWGQTLTHHPHVHCLVPAAASPSSTGAGSKPNRTSCSPSMRCRRPSAACSSRASSRVREGELSFFGELAGLAEPEAFKARMRALRQSPFVVYAKPPFGGPRACSPISPATPIARRSPIRAVDDNEVAFVYKDYRRDGRSGVMRLAPHEFIRRFLLHVLPDGFHRIRHYGFLAKADRGEKLAYVRDLLHVASKPQEQVDPEKGAVRRPRSRRRSRRLHALPRLRGLHAPH